MARCKKCNLELDALDRHKLCVVHRPCTKKNPCKYDAGLSDTGWKEIAHIRQLAAKTSPRRSSRHTRPLPHLGPLSSQSSQSVSHESPSQKKGDSNSVSLVVVSPPQGETRRYNNETLVVVSPPQGAHSSNTVTKVIHTNGSDSEYPGLPLSSTIIHSEEGNQRNLDARGNLGSQPPGGSRTTEVPQVASVSQNSEISLNSVAPRAPDVSRASDIFRNPEVCRTSDVYRAQLPMFTELPKFPELLPLLRDPIIFNLPGIFDPFSHNL